MKFFDWVKKLGKSNSDSAGELHPSADTEDEVPGTRRQLRLDERFLPKPAPKNYWEKHPPVLSVDEADRYYSPGFLNRNPKLRAIATDVPLLRERGLPVWTSEADVAEALGIELGTLRWLATHRYDDRLTHYYQYRIPKRAGGFRTIMAPKTQLKQAQRRLLAKLVHKLPVSKHAHGFVACRSVATNAKPHVGKRVVMRFDLEDFFGTVTFGRVRGYFIAMGYDYHVATTLALLTTEAARQPVAVSDDDVRHVPVGYRACPQGAPSSPAICNAIAMRLDRRLAGLAAAHGFTYTRYADDMTLSGDDLEKIGMLLRVVREIVEDEGFRLNAEKTHVMRDSGNQRVTGVTVNEVMGLSRRERRQLRAQLHQLSPNASREQREEAIGKLEYLRMLNPAQAAALRPSWLVRD